MKIALSLVSTNQKGLILKFLDSLSKFKIENEVEIIIRHNTPDKKIGKYKNLNISEYWNNQRKGFASNHNLNFHKSNSDVFMIINPDIIITSRCIDLLAKMSLNLDTLVSPLIMDEKNNPADFVRSPISFRYLFKRYFFSKNKVAHINKEPYFWVAGMFMVFPSNLYKKLNGLDEKFFLYCEDADISARIYLIGKRPRIIEDCKVIHLWQKDSSKKVKYFYFHLQSLLKFIFSKVNRHSRNLKKIEMKDIYINTNYNKSYDQNRK